MNLGAVLALLPALAAQPAVEVEFNDLAWGRLSVERVALDADTHTGWSLRVGPVSWGRHQLGELRADCAAGAWRWPDPVCADGELRWHLGAGEALTGRFALAPAAASLRIGRLELAVEQWRGPDWTLEARLPPLPLAAAGRFLPAGAGWPVPSGGEIEATLSATASGIEAQWSAQALGFDNADGTIAGVDLGLGAGFELVRAGAGAWRFRGDLAWRSGEALFGRWYLAAPGAPVTLEFNGHRLADGSIELVRLAFADPGVATAIGSADWSPPLTPLPDAGALERLAIELEPFKRRYLSGLLAPLALDGLGLAGAVELAGRYAGAADWRLAGRLDEVDIDDPEQRFDLQGLRGRWDWSGEGSGSARFHWSRARVYRVPLDAAGLRLQLAPDSIALARPFSQPVLGGALRIHALSVTGIGAGSGAPPGVGIDAEIEPLDLRRLTAALGWPEFGGELSGRIRDLRRDGEVWRLGGGLDVDVFNGRMSLERLRVERPFGVLPSLAATLRGEGLDLEPLTAAFSFGRMTGPVDIEVDNLRLLDWRPVRFDARIHTPAQAEGPWRISQRAVDTLSSLGTGPGAASSMLLRFFEDFGYQRIGWSCRLRGDICHMGGIRALDQGYLLVEGSGLPRLRVVGYHRRVAWRRLIEQLREAIQSRPRVGDD